MLIGGVVDVDLMLIWCWLMVEIGWDGDGTQDKSWGDKWDEAGSGESPWPERRYATARTGGEMTRDDTDPVAGGSQRSFPPVTMGFVMQSPDIDSHSRKCGNVWNLSASSYAQTKKMLGSLDWPRDSSQGLRAMKRSKQEMKLHCGAWHITPVSPIPQFLLVASPSIPTRPVTRGKWWFNVNLLHPFTIFFSWHISICFWLILYIELYRLYI